MNTGHRTKQFEETANRTYHFNMVIDAIREFLGQQPFRPFRVRASSGKSYIVSNPEMIVLLKSWVFIAAPNSDHFATVPYLHIASVGSISNGHSKRGAKRKSKE